MHSLRDNNYDVSYSFINNTVSISNIQFQISIRLNPMSFFDFT